MSTKEEYLKQFSTEIRFAAEILLRDMMLTLIDLDKYRGVLHFDRPNKEKLTKLDRMSRLNKSGNPEFITQWPDFDSDENKRLDISRADEITKKYALCIETYHLLVELQAGKYEALIAHFEKMHEAAIRVRDGYKTECPQGMRFAQKALIEFSEATVRDYKSCLKLLKSKGHT